MTFDFLTSPTIVFGAGTLDRLAELAPGLGRRALLVLGGTPRPELEARLARLLTVGTVARCAREPTVAEVDEAVEVGTRDACDLVVAVGGGSVLDCAKAAAAMMTNPGSLHDYLEGVGSGQQVERAPLPMIAVPTTAGTGSEVTKNAVISGPGYKKSVRSPMMIPDVALVDPLLTHTMPPPVTASCGMDALTQCLESYLSRNASPLTDGLALQGIAAAVKNLQTAYHRPDDHAAREGMMLASLLGGICLANAGLGAVHGFASPLGALFPLPHGVACAALLPQVVRANIDAASGSDTGDRLRRRFARVAAMMVPQAPAEERIEAGLDWLHSIQKELAIPRLADGGVTHADFDRIVAQSRGSSMRYNPVDLTDRQLHGILQASF